MKKVGNYMLISEIGKGQFGHVYKAQHTKTEAIYAIKSITKQSLNSTPKLKELFETETRIMSNIKHLNIMHLYELLETGNNYYLVLDYCRSGDMEGYVKKHNGLGEDEAVYFIMQIMNGFKELHKHKIMHRDFKLANIFLNNDTVVIGDFGFAKMANDMAITKLGSPITMAPEILLSNGGKLSYTNKADLWSIGVCFYEMIFGVEPWPNVKSVDDLKIKVRAHSGSQLAFPQNSRFSITNECRDLLIKLIEIDPNQRINWPDFYNHKLFVLHLNKKKGQDMTKSLMFRNNVDVVTNQFIENGKNKKGGDGEDFELNMDPEKIQGFENANFGGYEGPTREEMIKQRIEDRYTHEKRLLNHLIQTSVKLRNLSKDRINLGKAAPGLMYSAVLLLKKTFLLNQIALDSLKRSINVYNLEGFEIFITTNNRHKLIDEIEYQDIPNYNKLLNHIISKLKAEIDQSSPRTHEILAIAENPSLNVLSTLEEELRRESSYLVEFSLASLSSLPSNLKKDLSLAIAHLFVSAHHQTELAFLTDNIPFDWYMFDKSWEGDQGLATINDTLNKAFAQLKKPFR